MTMLLRTGYIVKKEKMGEKKEKEMKRELTVCPEIQGQIQKMDKFEVYRESETRYRIPRFYGVEKYGKPNVEKIKEGIEIDIKFKGELNEKTKQHEACEKTIEQLENKGGGILSLPTGYGKTTCALYIITKMRRKTLIIVHKEFLLNQWEERIRQFLPEASIGYIRQKKIDIEGKDIVIGMLQSIAMKEYENKVFDKIGFTIIDETHHICSKIFSRALFKISAKYMLGLSATPKRKDGLTKVMHWFLGPIAYSTERKIQRNVRVKMIRYGNYEKEAPVSVTGKLNMPAMISEIVEQEERNSIIQGVIEKEIKKGRKIIVLSDRRKHCEKLKEMGEGMNYTRGLYLGGMKQKELKENEKCDVIYATYSLAHEGLDIPELDTLILATPKTDVIQACGRILRETGEKKNEPLIYDIIDEYGNLINQSKKRKVYYKRTGFSIEEGKEEEIEKIEGYAFVEAQ